MSKEDVKKQLEWLPSSVTMYEVDNSVVVTYPDTINAHSLIALHDIAILSTEVTICLVTAKDWEKPINPYLAEIKKTARKIDR